MRKLLVISMCCLSCIGFSQELNCHVVVNAKQTGQEHLHIFKTLEKQLTEFINRTKWTNKTIDKQAQIHCNIIVNVSHYDNGAFQATLQIQSSRPVFEASYTTPVYNFKDNDFHFNYLEFQNLTYSPTHYKSNLVSVLAFHIYIVLGLDADTFSEKGGDPYFKQAQTIVNYSAQHGAKGWKLADGLRNRYTLVDDILSPAYAAYRNAMYTYHRKGLDLMSSDIKTGKTQIAASLKTLEQLNKERPNTLLLHLFLDAKADEIAQVFSGGPRIGGTNVKEILQNIAPTYRSQWEKITF